MPESWMELLRKFGGEYGAATGRPRRVGPVSYTHLQKMNLHQRKLNIQVVQYNRNYFKFQ